jgi:Ca2+-dependent lipid-binding protein
VLDYKEFLKRGEPTRYPGTLHLNIIGSRKLKSGFADKSDPFVEAKVSKGDKKIIKTKVIDDNENPTWNHSVNNNYIITICLTSYFVGFVCT